jgi:hypothetical protein
MACTQKVRWIIRKDEKGSKRLKSEEKARQMMIIAKKQELRLLLFFSIE